MNLNHHCIILFLLMIHLKIYLSSYHKIFKFHINNKIHHHLFLNNDLVSLHMISYIKNKHHNILNIILNCNYIIYNLLNIDYMILLLHHILTNIFHKFLDFHSNHNFLHYMKNKFLIMLHDPLYMFYMIIIHHIIHNFHHIMYILNH